jgi:hypothetical protein
MRLPNCVHQPACQTTTWVCGIKTELEHAIGRGDVTPAQANALLTKYDEFPIKGQKVYRGER